MASDKNIQTDGFRVTRDEAVELCIHHLRLAAMFFEAVPEDTTDLKTECKRIFKAAEADIALPAALHFIETIEKAYEVLKDEEDD